MRNHKNDFKTREFEISIVGYSDEPGVGYVRFANKQGDYLGAIDIGERLNHLEKLRNALDDILKQKRKMNKARS